MFSKLDSNYLNIAIIIILVLKKRKIWIKNYKTPKKFFVILSVAIYSIDQTISEIDI